MGPTLNRAQWRPMTELGCSYFTINKYILLIYTGFLAVLLSLQQLNDSLAPIFLWSNL